MSYPEAENPRQGARRVEDQGKPVPDQDDPLTAPFWRAANEGKLVIQRCQNCGTYHHPPQGVCWDCLSGDLRFEEISGRGTVYSFAIVRDQRIPAFDLLVPYIAATVALEEAPEITLPTNLPGTAPDDVRSGMKVRVEFEEIAPGIKIPQFRPVPGDRAVPEGSAA